MRIILRISTLTISLLLTLGCQKNMDSNLLEDDIFNFDNINERLNEEDKRERRLKKRKDFDDPFKGKFEDINDFQF